VNKVMTARFPGKCVACKQSFPAGTAILYSTSSRTTAHVKCPPVVVSAPEPKLVADVRNIIAFIEAARTRGLRNPKLRVLGPTGVGEVRMLVASRISRTPGALFVKHDGAYVGSVLPTGEVTGRLRSDDAMRTLLSVVNSAPLAAAKMFAAITCNCSFCGLPLTDEGSVEVGYGPVCAKHWGLPHKAKGAVELRGEVVVDTPASPVDDLLGEVEDDEREMQRIEAAGDRAQTARETAHTMGLW
jgi:hypothetical protein